MPRSTKVWRSGAAQKRHGGSASAATDVAIRDSVCDIDTSDQRAKEHRTRVGVGNSPASMRAMPDRAAPSLKGSRVLVTGASGLIGSHLLNVLDEDLEVIAVSRSSRPGSESVRWVVGDLERPGQIGAIVEAERPEVVIHLAGAVRGDRALDAVGPTLRANLVATVELLETSVRLGVRR